MGTMRNYRCKSCGYNKQLHLGSGMMYPRVSDSAKEAIAAGEHGDELKEAFDSIELPAVRPEEMIYVCPSCGCWDVYMDASVYEPTDTEAMKKREFGIKTVEEWGGVPYMTDYDIEVGDFRLVARYVPACPSCGEGMHPLPGASEDEPDAKGLKCPKCGSTDATIRESGWWD